LQLNLGDRRMKLGNRLSVFAQALKVQLNGSPNIAFYFLDGPACRDASG